MPNRVQWDPRFSVGNETLDAQHKHFLDRCNALADCLDDTGGEADRRFHETFTALMTETHAHFATEEALLVRCGYPEIEDHRSEREEYEFLAAEIATTDNFDKDELQTFLALWWAGHVMGAAKNHRAFLER